MPPLVGLVPDGGRLEQEMRRLDNTYFDTPGAGLRLFGVTLRRRVRGSETGWQLKVPDGTARTEFQSGSRTKTLPPALAKAVMGLRAGDRLGPVAVVTTTRTASRVLNADGELVVEIADDQVASGPPDGESMLHSWREVEVELGPAGKKKDLKQARKLLQAAGATPDPSGPNWIVPWGSCRRTVRNPQPRRARSGNSSPLTLRRSAMCLLATTSGCGRVRAWCTRLAWRPVDYAVRCECLET